MAFSLADIFRGHIVVSFCMTIFMAVKQPRVALEAATFVGLDIGTFVVSTIMDSRITKNAHVIKVKVFWEGHKIEKKNTHI